ncbi:CRISPR-associated endonuclease Cas1 [Candidatus Bathyarchaeota archaeon]|nr:CRISPR-associated endonuclease Cas1 [Candidatus Bathyarchaeota archaeon]MBS7618161.1 CRISPR-associated endonuclease Cas1 [Candidatus Bathyarchaeota archaeon]
MKRLVINEPGLFLRVRRGMIVVERRGEKILEVSPSNISQIVLLTRGATMSSAIFRLLARHKVDLVVYSGFGYPVARLVGSKSSGAIKLRKMQYEAQNEPLGVYLAKRFAWAKAVNQKAMLREAGKNKSDLRLSKELIDMSRRVSDLANAINNVIGSSTEAVRKEVMRLEAAAAEIYWQGFKLMLPEGVDFPGRRKRFEHPEDPINIMLNFCYGLLASEIWLAVDSSGLDPYAGFLHVDSPRRPALVMDILEEFRQPVVDRTVLRLASSFKDFSSIVEGRYLKREARFQVVKAFSERLSEVLTFSNRSLPLSSHIFLQPRRVAEFISGRSSDYAPFTLR